MKIDTNQLIEFYSKADVSFDNIINLKIPPGSFAKNTETHPQSGGLVIPLGGSACFSFDKSDYVLAPGMVVHAGPGIPLEKEVIGNVTWSYAVIHYRIPEVQFEEFPHYNSHFNIPVGLNPRLMDLLEKLTVGYTSSNLMSDLRCRTLFHNIIEEIVISADRQSRESSAELMESAAAFIQENFSNSFSMTALACQFGMDGRRFSGQFQKYIGITPVRYLTELRINRAKDLLKTCECPIMQIASCVGYEDPYYFSRTFKKMTGFSPREYQTLEKIHL